MTTYTESAPIAAAAEVGARPYFEIANLELPAILEGLPGNLRILDVGCGSGVHGAELKKARGHRVTGVDLSVSSIGKARHRMEAAYVGDITRPQEYPFASGFDVILFSDILEHMQEPLAVLQSHLALLKPGGRVLISLPNVAIWNVRLELLFGRFRYQDTGTLDRTHVRFFTRRSFHELLKNAGLQLEASRITPGVLRPLVPLIKQFYKRGAQDQSKQSDSSSIMDSAPYQFYCRYLYPLERLFCAVCPGLFAFQFVALCTYKPSAE